VNDRRPPASAGGVIVLKGGEAVFMHLFEIMTPDGEIIHTTTLQVYTAHGVVRARHRVIALEVPPTPLEQEDDRLSWDWDDFTLEEPTD
jgi:hypothetical protein